MGIFKKEARTKPDRVLQEGWQFYHRPTTLEPVGTVFRIDRDRRRYLVETLTVKSTRGQEASARLEDSVEIGAGVLARLLGIGPKADAKAQLAEKIVFELDQPEREVTTDMALSEVLDPFLLTLKYRADCRYFLIRECRWATAMTYRLCKERVLALGGEATLNGALAVGVELKTVNERLYEINCSFSEEMRVMFLPEEIRPVSAGLGGDTPELGCVPVHEPLVWDDQTS
jgi:hypothetical protein